jgi:hypothetical protein
MKHTKIAVSDTVKLFNDLIERADLVLGPTASECEEPAAIALRLACAGKYDLARMLAAACVLLGYAQFPGPFDGTGAAPRTGDTGRERTESLIEVARDAERMFRNFASADPAACLTAHSAESEACDIADRLAAAIERTEGAK